MTLLQLNADTRPIAERLDSIESLLRQILQALLPPQPLSPLGSPSIGQVTQSESLEEYEARQRGYIDGLISPEMEARTQRILADFEEFDLHLKQADAREQKDAQGTQASEAEAVHERIDWEEIFRQANSLRNGR